MGGCIKGWLSSLLRCWNSISLCSLKVRFGFSVTTEFTYYDAYSLFSLVPEPLLPTQPEEIADLARMVSTPIALGERLYTRNDFRPYLEKRAIDIAQPDVRPLLW